MTRSHVERGSVEDENNTSESNSSAIESSSGETTSGVRSSNSDRDSSSVSSEHIDNPLNGSNQQSRSPRLPPGRQRKRHRTQKTAATRKKRQPHHTTDTVLGIRGSRSAWVTRECQFEKFRSSIIVLPTPEGVIRVEKAKAYSLHVKSVANWVIPGSVLSSRTHMKPKRTFVATATKDDCADYDSSYDESDDQEDIIVTLGVHVSLFHEPSKRFFGSTWVSPEICVNLEQIKPNRDPKTNSLRYVMGGVALNFRAYFVSDVVDSNCVGVVELVAYRKDSESKATVLAAGCGWSILPLFAQSVGGEAMSNAELSFTSATAVSSNGESICVFTGNPRVLWELKNAGEWQSYPRHEQSKFYYHLHSFEPLAVLAPSGFIRRNEIISALEVIPGLKHGNLAGVDAGTNPKLMLMRDSGSGDENQDDISAYEGALSSFARICSLVPKTVQLQECFTLNVQALRVFMHLRNEVEANLISRLKLSRRTIHDGASSVEGGHISARVLKLALHNGRTFRTRQHTVPLKVDELRGDDAMKCEQTSPARLKGFVFHPYMAIVVSLQFTVHFRVSWPAKLKQQALDAKPMRVLPEDDVVTVTMASRVVVPSDGKKLYLHDRGHLSNTEQTGMGGDHHALHVDLLSGPACRPYTDNPVYTPPHHIISAARSDRSTSPDSIAFADLVLTVVGGETSKNSKTSANPIDSSKVGDEKTAAEHWAKKILAKADANSVLAQTLNALATTTHKPSTGTRADSNKEERGTSPVRPPSTQKTSSLVQEETVPLLQLDRSPVTELSRASRTLLMRHGFIDAHDTLPALGKKSKPMSNGNKGGLEAPKVLRHELEDIYKAHEIRFHFAAFRVVSTSPLSNTSTPSRLYFTFQFYHFPPMRTETLRLGSPLSLSGPSHTYLLMRESPANKPSLAIQYDVDTTASPNPHESRQFATYLLTKTLYVDVWDAESLFHIGTCAVPLHELLRQGAGVKKFQGEVDVWESSLGTTELSSPLSNLDQHSSNYNATHLDELRSESRPIIGKLQILLSNYGSKGRNAEPMKTNDSVPQPVVTRTVHQKSIMSGTKHRVRARPLTENNAELHRLLVDRGLYNTQGCDQRENAAQNAQRRTLLRTRNEGDATTLTAKEVDLLCEIFRTNKSGSASHSNRIACDREGRSGLMALLSLRPPSQTIQTTHGEKPFGPAVAVSSSPSSIAEEPVQKLRDHLKRVIMRAIDKGVQVHQVFMDFDTFGDGNLSYDELGFALKQLGVEYSPDDTSACTIMERLLSQFDSDGDGSVSYEEFLKWLGIDVARNKKDVVKLTILDMEQSVREVFQRLEAKGIDVEELFDHFDTDKNGTLDMIEFKSALGLCLQKESSEVGGQVLASLNEEALRGLIKNINKNDDMVVDYHEFLTFCGVESKTPREDREKKRSLSQAERKLIKLLLRALSKGVTINELFQHFDKNTDGSISVREFTNTMDALFQISRSLSEEDIRAVTVRFDSNGDGSISFAEFQAFVEEMRTAQQKLMALFKPIIDRGELVSDEKGSLVSVNQWKLKCSNVFKVPRDQLDHILGWMETLGLVDEKNRVNSDDLVLLCSSMPSDRPRVVDLDKTEVGTKLRDFLALALAKGVDARRCFAHFDPDGDGEITASELRSALRQLGDQFENVSDEVVDSMIRELDVDGSGKISFGEFQCLFPRSEQPKDTSSSQAKEKSRDVLTWLTELLAAAVNKGMDVGACFDHFDKDKSGAITRTEFMLAMQELIKNGSDGIDFNEALLVQAMDQIDRDHSGEISLIEFKRLLLPTSTAPSSKADGSDEGQPEETKLFDSSSKSVVERLRDLLGSAERCGVSIAQSFAHFDVDNDGSITRDEFSIMVRALPGFEAVKSHEIMQVIEILDANASGNVSLDEFQAFVHSQPHSAGLSPGAITSKCSIDDATSIPACASPEESITGGDAHVGKMSQNDLPTGGSNAEDRESLHTTPNSMGSGTKEVLEHSNVESTVCLNRGGLRRTGSDSASGRHNEVKTVVRASTDPETIANEASRSQQKGSKIPSKAAPTLSARRPSFADARAAARITTREKNGEVFVEKSDGGASRRRTSLAENRAGERNQNPTDTGSLTPPSNISGGSGASTSPPKQAAEKNPTKLSTSIEVEKSPVTETLAGSKVQTPQIAIGAQKEAIGMAVAPAQRTSLAEARATGRAMRKTSSSVSIERPHSNKGARRQSVNQAHAAPGGVMPRWPSKPDISPMTSLEQPNEIRDGLLNLHNLLSQAQASGVDLHKALEHFDKDENGKLLYDEFARGLKELGSNLTGVSAEAALGMARRIDLGHKGFITVQDFQVFLQQSLSGKGLSQHIAQGIPSESVNAQPKSLSSEIDCRSLSIGGSLSARDSSARSIVLESERANAITRDAGACSTTQDEMATITKETRTEVTPISQPPTSAPGDVSNVSSVFTSESSHVLHDYECAYEFHSDPAIRSVEVKLRRAAIDAYSRGVFPTRIIQKYLDSSSSNSSSRSRTKSELRRVEFLQVLMEMGFSLLSESNEEGDDDSAVDGASCGPKMHDHLYARQLERLARYKHHTKQVSRAEKALARAVQQMQQRSHKERAKASSASKTRPLSTVTRFIHDKSQLQRVLSYYRDGHKKSLVYSLLRDQVTTHIAFFPSFAALVFAELAFVNPYPHQERFRLEFLAAPAAVDADIIKSSDEWRFYRQNIPLSYGELPLSASSVNDVEHDMVDPENELVLDSSDQIAIPIKLRWLEPTTTTTTAKPSTTMSLAVRSCTHGHTVALFKLELFPQAFACHRVLRFVHPANSVWKWTVNCPPGKHFVCLDPSVAAVTEPSPPSGKGMIVSLKCRVGSYPSLEEFYVVIYDDEYFARIDEVWQIRVQSAMRLDVHTLLGQTIRSELVIRGDGAGSKPRHVRCFTTWHHAKYVSFRPSQIFQLVGDAYNRIEWRFCAAEMPAPSLCRVRVHLVDVNSMELVGSWILCVSLGRPAITKSYELTLPQTQGAQKKIAYSNPWDQPQTVVLRSSDPTRMRPRDNVLQVPPLGQIFMRLVFPATSAMQRDESDLLLFVNDQQTEQSEECLRFQVSYN